MAVVRYHPLGLILQVFRHFTSLAIRISGRLLSLILVVCYPPEVDVLVGKEYVMYLGAVPLPPAGCLYSLVIEGERYLVDSPSLRILFIYIYYPASVQGRTVLLLLKSLSSDIYLY